MKQQTIPKLTQEFMKDIESKAIQGVYQVTIKYDEADVVIEVFPYVFPPSSEYSASTKSVYTQFGNLRDKRVLDIGTGTGIQAIVAALAGAKKVDAVDISHDSVRCARYNVNQNKLENQIQVYHSDMFSNIDKDNKYDLIIANLPILNINYGDEKFSSLFDPNFRNHEILFQEADKYLTANGKITLSHANLQSKDTELADRDFTMLEDLARTYNYVPRIINRINDLGYEWRCYEFKKE